MLLCSNECSIIVVKGVNAGRKELTEVNFPGLYFYLKVISCVKLSRVDLSSTRRKCVIFVKNFILELFIKISMITLILMI